MFEVAQSKIKDISRMLLPDQEQKSSDESEFEEDESQDLIYNSHHTRCLLKTKTTRQCFKQ